MRCIWAHRAYAQVGSKIDSFIISDVLKRSLTDFCTDLHFIVHAFGFRFTASISSIQWTLWIGRGLDLWNQHRKSAYRSGWSMWSLWKLLGKCTRICILLSLQWTSFWFLSWSSVGQKMIVSCFRLSSTYTYSITWRWDIILERNTCTLIIKNCTKKEETSTYMYVGWLQRVILIDFMF